MHLLISIPDVHSYRRDLGPSCHQFYVFWFSFDGSARSWKSFLIVVNRFGGKQINVSKGHFEVVNEKN